MSQTAWTGMLAPALLDILVEANKVAGLDGAKTRRCLLRQVKLFATVNYLRNVKCAGIVLRAFNKMAKTAFHLVGVRSINVLLKQKHWNSAKNCGRNSLCLDFVSIRYVWYCIDLYIMC